MVTPKPFVASTLRAIQVPDCRPLISGYSYRRRTERYRPIVSATMEDPIGGLIISRNSSTFGLPSRAVSLRAPK